jgi:hypothetical protein
MTRTLLTTLLFLCAGEQEVGAGSAAQTTTGSEWTERPLCDLR